MIILSAYSALGLNEQRSTGGTIGDLTLKVNVTAIPYSLMGQPLETEITLFYTISAIALRNSSLHSRKRKLILKKLLSSKIL
jgi:hypothetical protein